MVGMVLRVAFAAERRSDHQADAEHAATRSRLRRLW